MRYLLAFLLAVSPLLAADVTVKAKGVNAQRVAEAEAVAAAHDDLLDEPANGDIVTALESAGPLSLIQFSKASYDDACTTLSVCEAKTAAACTLLGGAIDAKGAGMFERGNLCGCAATCVLPDKLWYRIRFVCTSEP